MARFMQMVSEIVKNCVASHSGPSLTTYIINSALAKNEVTTQVNSVSYRHNRALVILLSLKLPADLTLITASLHSKS
jgi:hypothetical protein